MSPSSNYRTPVANRAFLDPRQLSIQLARAPPRRNNPRRRRDNNEGFSFTVRTTPNAGPPTTMRLRVNLNVVAVDGEPRAPRVQVRPAVDGEGEDDGAVAARTRASSTRATRGKKAACNHALDRKFCSKCHIRRRHLNRWWLRQQYQKH